MVARLGGLGTKKGSLRVPEPSRFLQTLHNSFSDPWPLLESSNSVGHQEEGVYILSSTEKLRRNNGMAPPLYIMLFVLCIID